jgi:hypothetical protein
VTLARKSPFPLTRILIAAFGISAVAWSFSAIRVYRAETVFAGPALRILAEDRFNSEQLDTLRQQIEAAPVTSLRATALGNIATIRLRLAEVAMQTGNAQVAAAAFDNLKAAVAAALERGPTNSFMWLTDYWVSDVRGGNPVNGLNSLGMSYAEGPNEGWIAVRRNPVALSAFSSLPDQLADQALNEFAKLVSSGYYSEAANILAGSGWPVHDKLLAGLAQLDEGNRRRFAKALESKDLDGVAVPGIEARPAGPL